MTIMQLRYFLAICEYGKLRVTAEHIHVSEPAISVSIKRLEDEVGAPLFTRDRRQLFLTEDGKYLRERAGEVVAAFNRLEAEMERRRQKRPSVFRIGAPSSLAEYVFPPLFDDFMEAYPAAQFEFVPGASLELARQVMEERLELAICDRMETDLALTEFLPLIRSEMVGCVCPEHPLAGRERVSARELEHERMLFMSENATPTKEARRWFLSQGIELNVFMYSNRSSYLIPLIRRHNAVTFYLTEVFSGIPQIRQEGLCSFTLEPPLVLTHGLICKHGRKLSKEAQLFFDFCRGRQID